MFKARINTQEGPLYILGLSFENLDRVPDEPIICSMVDLGAEGQLIIDYDAEMPESGLGRDYQSPEFLSILRLNARTIENLRGGGVLNLDLSLVKTAGNMSVLAGPDEEAIAIALVQAGLPLPTPPGGVGKYAYGQVHRRDGEIVDAEDTAVLVNRLLQRVGGRG